MKSDGKFLLEHLGSGITRDAEQRFFSRISNMIKKICETSFGQLYYAAADFAEADLKTESENLLTETWRW